MKKTVPYWHPQADYSQVPFFIRKMNTHGSIKPADVPSAALPMVGFVYLTEGELLTDVAGEVYRCLPGHLLLIPHKTPFSIRFYQDAHGYTGGFSPALGGEKNLPVQPLLHAFWFEEARFVGELFEMMLGAFRQGRTPVLEKALGLLLSLVDMPTETRHHPLANAFLEQVLDPSRGLRPLDEYAQEAGLTPNGFGRMIRRETGRSPGAWIDIARLNRAKHLLQETEWPVIDVAAAIGLEDQSYFARFFRKQTGMTPTDFRKKMSPKHE